MIYTVTFNPALDYVVRVNHFALGGVNRSVEEHVFCGGKGINVSAILTALGVPNTALGFVAGFTGAEIERGLEQMGVSSDFVHVKNGMSRINVKLKAEEETEINGMGPELSEEDMAALFAKLDHLQAGDSLVLSGSIPASIRDNVYEEILSRLEGRGIRVIVDAEKGLLLHILQYRPFLIKPNHHELGDIFHRELKTSEEIVEHAKRLQECGVRNVLVSMAGDGAILVAENGRVYERKPPRGVVKNSVGAGDSMVAGFLAGYEKSRDYEEALRLGTAAGSATAFCDGLATAEEIRKLYECMKS